MRSLLTIGLFGVVVGCSNASHGTTGTDGPTAVPDGPVSMMPPDAPMSIKPDATIYRYLCDAPLPEGAAIPAIPAAPAAGCPVLTSGTNTFTSGGNSRQFIVVDARPTSPPEEHLPVLFLWHWIGGDANDFFERGDVQAAADEQRFIAVIPVEQGRGRVRHLARHEVAVRHHADTGAHG